MALDFGPTVINRNIHGYVYIYKKHHKEKLQNLNTSVLFLQGALAQMLWRIFSPTPIPGSHSFRSITVLLQANNRSNTTWQGARMSAKEKGI